jgi:hypothetical protein
MLGNRHIDVGLSSARTWFQRYVSPLSIIALFISEREMNTFPSVSTLCGHGARCSYRGAQFYSGVVENGAPGRMKLGTLMSLLVRCDFDFDGLQASCSGDRSRVPNGLDMPEHPYRETDRAGREHHHPSIRFYPVPKLLLTRKLN